MVPRSPRRLDRRHRRRRSRPVARPRRLQSPAAIPVPKTERSTSPTWSTTARRRSSPPKALVEAFEAENPDITVDVQTRPQGAEGDNLVKTRLATGEMDDVFHYNSGSLLPGAEPRRHARQPRRTRRGSTALDENFVDASRPRTASTARRSARRWPARCSTTRTSTTSSGSRSRRRGTSSSRTARRSRRRARQPDRADLRRHWTSQLFVLGDFDNVARRGPGLGRAVHGQRGEVRRRAGARQASSTCRRLREGPASTRTSRRRPTTTACDGRDRRRARTTRCSRSRVAAS